jgi:hypothetical protein
LDDRFGAGAGLEAGLAAGRAEFFVLRAPRADAALLEDELPAFGLLLVFEAVLFRVVTAFCGRRCCFAMHLPDGLAR